MRNDIYYLTFDGLRDVVATGNIDQTLVRQRRAEFQTAQGPRAPRVMTSDGDVITGRYRRDEVPDGALVGLAVSAGTVEGRARVIHDMAETDLSPGDILVTACTDPSWTPVSAPAS